MTISLLASVCPCRHRRPSCNYLPQACDGPRTINNYSSLTGASSSFIVLTLSSAAGCRVGLRSDGGKILVRKARYLKVPGAMEAEQDLTLKMRNTQPFRFSKNLDKASLNIKKNGFSLLFIYIIFYIMWFVYLQNHR